VWALETARETYCIHERSDGRPGASKSIFFHEHVYDTCFIKTKKNTFTRRIGNQQLPNPSPSVTTIRTVLHEQFCDVRQWRLRFHKPCQSD
jgi:hypothetical protein